MRKTNKNVATPTKPKEHIEKRSNTYKNLSNTYNKRSNAYNNLRKTYSNEQHLQKPNENK